jgi:Tol biopolymer transport system component
MDGSEQKNLSDSAGSDVSPVFSPDSRYIAYESYDLQNTNPEGDREVYRMNAVDGFGQVNFSNNGLGIDDQTPEFSPDGQKITYASSGTQTSNVQGDGEVYRMSALDGTNKKNLSNNGAEEYHPDWGRQAM